MIGLGTKPGTKYYAVDFDKWYEISGRFVDHVDVKMNIVRNIKTNELEYATVDEVEGRTVARDFDSLLKLGLNWFFYSDSVWFIRK